jgi:tetratricopeptide (TPR) repeat protein
VAALVGITLAAFLARRRVPAALVGWLFFLGTLVPVIGLVQVGSQAHADRFTYLPHIGLLAAVVWSAAAVAGRYGVGAKVQFAGVALVVGLLVAGTRVQIGYWADDVTQWQHQVAVVGSNWNPIGHSNLGRAYSDAGRLPEALDEYSAACRESPDGQFHANRASALLKLKRYDEAEQEVGWAFTEGRPFLTRADEARFWFVRAEVSKVRGRFEDALRGYETSIESADSFAARNNLGTLLMRLGRPREAVRHLEAARVFNPDSAEVDFNLGSAFAQTADWATAVPYLERACSREPGNTKYRGLLAITLYAAGRTSEAEQSARDTARADPTWPISCVRTAWALSTDPDPNRRNGPLAYWTAAAAGLVAKPPPWQLLEAQAAAAAELGRFDEAVSLGEEAARADRSGKPEVASQIRARITLYSQKQPFRTSPPPQ